LNIIHLLLTISIIINNRILLINIYIEIILTHIITEYWIDIPPLTLRHYAITPLLMTLEYWLRHYAIDYAIDITDITPLMPHDYWHYIITPYAITPHNADITPRNRCWYTDRRILHYDRDSPLTLRHISHAITPLRHYIFITPLIIDIIHYYIAIDIAMPLMTLLLPLIHYIDYWYYCHWHYAITLYATLLITATLTLRRH
jgi:hypothetical protein